MASESRRIVRQQVSCVARGRPKIYPTGHIQDILDLAVLVLPFLSPTHFYSTQPPSTTMLANHDPSAYPHIWDAIIGHSHDVQTALALRATCHHLKEAVTRILHLHLAVTGAYWRYGSQSLVTRYYTACGHTHAPSSFTDGFFRAFWHQRSLRIRLPPAYQWVSWGRELVQTRCHQLDICHDVIPEELDFLAYLIEPRVLRIFSHDDVWGTTLCLGLVLNALKAIRSQTAIFSLSTMGRIEENHPRTRPGLLAALPDCTRRVVIHQRVTSLTGDYALITGAGLREVVLVFRLCLHTRWPCGEQFRGEVRLPFDKKNEPIPKLLNRLVLDLPGVAFTIVGLETAFPDINTTELRDRFQDAHVEFRTLAEHKDVLSVAQWELEMGQWTEPMWDGYCTICAKLR